MVRFAEIREQELGDAYTSCRRYTAAIVGKNVGRKLLNLRAFVDATAIPRHTFRPFVDEAAISRLVYKS
jgi:hypothetical protein